MKGLLLAAVGLGTLRLVHADVADTLLVEPALRRLVGLEPHTLTTISLGALAWAALLLTEGVGLMQGKRWAEYFTLIARSSLVPLEVDELGRHATATRLTALLVNVAIVAYLGVRVRRRTSAHDRRRFSDDRTSSASRYSTRRRRE